LLALNLIGQAIKRISGGCRYPVLVAWLDIVLRREQYDAVFTIRDTAKSGKLEKRLGESLKQINCDIIYHIAVAFRAFAS